MSLAGVETADAALSPAGGVVRPLEERDLAGVTALHAKYLPKADRAAEEALQRDLARVLLPAVNLNKALPSLVYEGDDGRVIGCLGVMPRPMSFQGRSITAAVSHSFIVEAGSRSSTAAQELVRRFLAGPQDLSMAESGRISRKLWELDGGCVSLLHGLCWTRPLRPSSYLLSLLGRRGLSATRQRLLRPLCRAADAAAPLLVKSFRFPAPPVQTAKLVRRTLCASLAQFTRGRALHPRYSEPQVKWMLESLEGKQGQGEFHQIAVRNLHHQIIGWYLCYIKPGAVATVVQIGADEEGADQVLDHLFHFAYRRGAVAVSGQADPALFPALARKQCLFHFDGGSYFLLHSRNPELLQAIQRGDAFLSPFGGRVVDQLSAQLIMEERPSVLRAARWSETFEAAAEAGDYHVEVVRDRDALQALAPEWNRAVAEAGIEHPFLSHEWISTWWDSFGAGRSLHVILVRCGGRLVGVAPLLRGEERLYGLRLRYLQSPYNPHVPRFGFIAAREPEAVYRAVWQHLRDIGDEWDVIRLSQVPAESELMRRLLPMAEADGYIAGVWHSERSPYLVIDRDWDFYERHLGRAHRRNVRNRLNRLAKLGEVKLEVISGAEGLNEILSEGFQLEAAAWKGLGGTAVVSRPEVERFYRTLAAAAAARGGLRLYFLTVGGTRIAFSFALYQGNRIYSLKVGYDPAFRRYSPSTLQCYLELHRAFDTGITEFDFLGNDDVWKLQWSSRVRPHDWLFVFAPRWRSRLAAWIKFRGLPRLRQWRLYGLLHRLRQHGRQEAAPADDQH